MFKEFLYKKNISTLWKNCYNMIVKIFVERAYKIPLQKKHFRILVDRLWPRGLTKEKLNVDLWEKQLAPSDDLRKWYHNNPQEWDNFKHRYYSELLKNQEYIREFITRISDNEAVVFLYSSKNVITNNARALAEFLAQNYPDYFML